MSRKKQCDHIEGKPHEMLFLCKLVHFLFERIFILISIQSERQVPVPSASARKWSPCFCSGSFLPSCTPAQSLITAKSNKTCIESIAFITLSMIISYVSTHWKFRIHNIILSNKYFEVWGLADFHAMYFNIPHLYFSWNTIDKA